MKTINIDYQSFKNVEEINKLKFYNNKYNSLVIQAFCGILDKNVITTLINELYLIFPKAHLIGTSTGGEIISGKEKNKTITLSFSFFESTLIKQERIIYDSSDFLNHGRELGKKIIDHNTKACIVFSEGFTTNGESLVKGISSINRNTLISGGLAGDNLNYKETFVFDYQGIIDRGAVMVALSGENLIAKNSYNFDWSAAGRYLTITKAEGNRVYEIDNEPAFDIYKKYLGKSLEDNFHKVTNEFPLLVEKNGLNIGRAVMKFNEDNSLDYSGNFKPGDTAQFSFGNAEMIVESAQTAIDQLANTPIESIFVYSCVGRRAFLGNAIEIETLSLNKIAPTSGFFTYGEFFHHENTAELLTHTITILTLSESSKVERKALQKNKPELDLKTIGMKMLSHLISQTTKEIVSQSEKYKTAKDRLSNFTSAIGEGLVALSHGAVIEFLNPAVEKITGYNNEYLIGKRIDSINLFKEKELIKIRNLIKEYNNNEANLEDMQIIIPIVKKNGVIALVECHVNSLTNSGNYSGAIIVFKDVTEREAKSRELKLTNSFLDSYKNAIDASSIVFKTNLNGVFTFVNDKFCELSKYSKNELIGRNFSFLSPNSTESMRFVVLEEIRRFGLWSGQREYFDKDGNSFDVYETIVPIRNDKKVIEELIGVQHNITNLHQALQRATKAEKSKSEFLAHMSHEIRTPMNAILGFGEMLLANETDNSKKETLETIRKAGKHLLKIINDILDFSKLEAGQVQLNEKTFAISAMLEHIYKLLHKRAEKKGLNFTINIEDKISDIVIGDEQRVSQIFTNLLGNSLKFTKEGEININVRQTEKYYEFIISDTGIGISNNKLDQIFTAFRQGDSSVSRKYGGTGLGLAISQKIARSMKGEIEVSSQLGVGSSFSLRVPLKCSTKRKIISKIRRIENFNDNRKIAVIDNVLEKSQIVSILEKHNLDSVYISLDSDIIDKILDFDIQLIVINLDLLEVLNSEIFIKIRENEETMHIPIIAFSPIYNVETKVNFGFYDYLSYKNIKESFSELFHQRTSFLSNTLEIFVIEDDLQKRDFLQANLDEKNYNLHFFDNDKEAARVLNSSILPEVLLINYSCILDIKEFSQKLSKCNCENKVMEIIILLDDIYCLQEQSKIKSFISTLNTKLNTKKLIRQINYYLLKDNETDNALIPKTWVNSISDDIDFKNLIKAGIRVLPTKIQELKKLVSENKWDEIKIFIHTFKGFTGSYRMKEIYEICIEFEKTVLLRPVNICLINEFIKEFEQVLSFIPESYFVQDDFLPLKILVAEDNLMNQKLIKTFLSKLELDCDIANNGKVALEKMNKEKYDLLLLDIQMPIVDGLEVLRILEESNKLQDLHIIALTANAIAGDHEKYVNAGCNDYLAKPIDLELLESKIRLLQTSTKENLEQNSKKIIVKNNKTTEVRLLINEIVNNMEIFDPEYVISKTKLITNCLDLGAELVLNKIIELAENYDDESILSFFQDLEKKL